MSRTFKEALDKRLSMNANDIETVTPNDTIMDLLVQKTVKKVIDKPTTVDVLNLAKVKGEFDETPQVNVSIEEALKDCKA